MRLLSLLAVAILFGFALTILQYGELTAATAGSATAYALIAAVPAVLVGAIPKVPHFVVWLMFGIAAVAITALVLFASP